VNQVFFFFPETRAMQEYGVLTAAGTIRFERLLPGPIEGVWACLTESEQRAKWLAAGPMELRVGGRVQLAFHHADLSTRPDPTPERFESMEHGASMEGRITRLEPPRLLSYTWGEASHPSEVTFELTEQGTQVLLVLTHRGLRDRGEMLDVASGWHAHVDVLTDRLTGREETRFWTNHTRLAAEYQTRLPAA
jgi:uncharacterized protein YndB with AHSA1/START domain